MKYCIKKPILLYPFLCVVILKYMLPVCYCDDLWGEGEGLLNGSGACWW